MSYQSHNSLGTKKDMIFDEISYPTADSPRYDKKRVAGVGLTAGCWCGNSHVRHLTPYLTGGTPTENSQKNIRKILGC